MAAMVPTEDTIEALLDYLVYPLLPLRESNDEMPSDHQQKTIAKQLHAIVILYNYYHRKQFPKLEFLGFESFCKICCMAKPGLLPYLRYMHRSEEESGNFNNQLSMHRSEEESGNLNNQLSIAEKMVMDACNICIGLDSAKDYPFIEGWPVSKVAVFLVLPAKEKCMLQFGNITLGVWSLVEKDLEAHSENGFSQTESYKSDEVLEQLAFSAVEQETGINHSDLDILERHLTYALSHEKSATQLYIMKYGRTLSEEVTEVSIKDVIRSLEGPIVKKDSTCEITSVVEYFSILPYIEIVSSWLSRDISDHVTLDIRRQQIVNEKKCRLGQNEITSVKDHDVRINFVSNELMVDIQNGKPSKSETIEANGKDLSKVNGSSRPDARVEITSSTPSIELDRLSFINDQPTNDKSVQNGLDKNVLNSKKNKLKDAITYNRRACGSSRTTNSCMLVDSKHVMLPDKLPTIADNGISKKSGSNEQKLNVKSSTSDKAESITSKKNDNGVSENSGSYEQKLNVESNIPVKTEGRVAKKNATDLSLNNGTLCEISRLQNMESDGPVTASDQTTNDVSLHSEQTKDVINSMTDNIKDAIPNNKKSADSHMRVLSVAIDSCKGDDLPVNDHQKPSQKEDIIGKIIISDATVNEKSPIHIQQPVSLDGQAGPVDTVKFSIEDGAYGNSDIGATQEVSALGDLSLVPMQSTSKGHGAFYQVMASGKNDLLQASLQILQKKRDELYQQKHFLEDEIARCEMNIQAIFGGEENPSLKVETIIEALNCYCSSQVQNCMNLSSEDQSSTQTIKRRKLSEEVLTSRNSGQDLDDICCKNSWMLPQYSVLPSFADSHITGMFNATVTVYGMDFVCTSNGGCKSSPREARESAATQMLCKLRMWQAREQ